MAASTSAPSRNWTETPAISADGRYVAFVGHRADPPSCTGVSPDRAPCTDVFLDDRTTGSISLVSRSTTGTAGNDSSWGPSISGDGRYIAFVSSASNLVQGDTNRCASYSTAGDPEPTEARSCPDIFVRDRIEHTTTRISISSSGTQGNGASLQPAVSANGRFVAFTTQASNLASQHATDVRCGKEPGYPDCSDVLIRDLQGNSTELVSVADSGNPLNGSSSAPSISSDGTRIAFLVQRDGDVPRAMYVRDRTTPSTIQLSPSGFGLNGSISGNGRYVVFGGGYGSAKASLSVYRLDLSDGSTTLASISRSRGLPDGVSGLPSISSDGRYIGFESTADDLIAGLTISCVSEVQADTRIDCPNVYRRDMTLGKTILVSVGTGGHEGNGDSQYTKVSGKGSVIAFVSTATNLTRDPVERTWHVFIRDLGSSTTVRISLSWQ
ncbi:MAG: TolB family protein [Actinomycetota bacterium]